MNRLKELREEAMLTVRELSERSGVSEDTITKIENGHRKGRSMTLRKLARALGSSPFQLFPEAFDPTTGAEVPAPEVLPQDRLPRLQAVNPTESDFHNATMLEAAISRAYEAIREIEQPAEVPPSQRRYPDGVPRMNISERQQKVLITVLECGEVGPSTVADRLEISVSTAYRDLSVLEEHGLVMADESGKRLISPLGRDLVEAIISARNRLNYDEALNLIATLMKAHESVAGLNLHRASNEEETAFYMLQDIIIQSIRRIVVARELSPVAQIPTRKLHDNLLVNSVLVDTWDLAREVWTVLNRYMTSPPSQQVIRADIEDAPRIDVLEALDLTVAAYLVGRFGAEAEDREQVYRTFLWLLRKPHHRRYPKQQSEGDSPQQAHMRNAKS
jgi:transcriptional regulator with XRE-family HTH domain